MTLGERIKSARETSGLTQEELGKKCGTTKQTIYKYENGIITNIPLDRLEVIANAVNISATYLMGWDEKEKPTSNNTDGLNEDEIDAEVFKLLQELSPSQLEQAKSYLRFLSQQDNS